MPQTGTAHVVFTLQRSPTSSQHMAHITFPTVEQPDDALVAWCKAMAQVEDAYKGFERALAVRLYAQPTVELAEQAARTVIGALCEQLDCEVEIAITLPWVQPPPSDLAGRGSDATRFDLHVPAQAFILVGSRWPLHLTRRFPFIGVRRRLTGAQRAASAAQHVRWRKTPAGERVPHVIRAGYHFTMPNVIENITTWWRRLQQRKR